jgi:hypothetical protein
MGFLATITSWVVGFITGAVFALLAYLFYAIGVAIVAGALGYALGAGFMNLIGLDWGLVVWIVGIVVAVALIIVTFYFNLQKYIIIAATSIGGAGVLIGTLMFGVTGMAIAKFFENPIRNALSGSPIWTILFIVLAIAGIALQIMMNKEYDIEAYENRI